MASNSLIFLTFSSTPSSSSALCLDLGLPRALERLLRRDLGIGLLGRDVGIGLLGRGVGIGEDVRSAIPSPEPFLLPFPLGVLGMGLLSPSETPPSSETTSGRSVMSRGARGKGRLLSVTSVKGVGSVFSEADAAAGAGAGLEGEAAEAAVAVAAAVSSAAATSASTASIACSWSCTASADEGSRGSDALAEAEAEMVEVGEGEVGAGV
mmetsp:Transcript_25/g.45  ORF Transcript_25/g.45 Transcript_25/m.45 type:complete len:209 (-) Transcript_25:125-751(-)